MSIAESLLPEFDHEMASTRKLLERVPEEHADWAPHPKSTRLGRLAVHLAELPGLVERTLRGTELDINPAGGPTIARRQFQSRADTLALFDTNVAAARAAIAGASDEDFKAPWSLKNGGRTIFTLPRAAAYRTMMLNHVIHHRGQMTVYLRLRDVPVPGVYGPTADEPA